LFLHCKNAAKKASEQYHFVVLPLRGISLG
jgi:hypothetical protein